jgi:hypothetical protein
VSYLEIKIADGCAGGAMHGDDSCPLTLATGVALNELGTPAGAFSAI